MTQRCLFKKDVIYINKYYGADLNLNYAYTHNLNNLNKWVEYGVWRYSSFNKHLDYTIPKPSI